MENRRTVVAAGHGVGKSFVSACIVLAYLHANPNTKVVTTAPTERQVKAVLWSEIRRLYARLNPEGGIAQDKLELEPNWFAIGISPDARTNFQGYHAEHMLIVLDEAPGVSADIFWGADSLMSAGRCRMLMIGNPIERSGHFWEAWRSPNWNQIRISCEDVPQELTFLTSREWIAEKREDWGVGNPEYQSKVLGRFPTSATDQLIDVDDVRAAQKRTNPPASDAPRGLGVDVARFGYDSTVFCYSVGDKVVSFDEMRDASTMEVAGRIIAERDNYDWVAVDDIGVGAGVVDRLREVGVKTLAVNVAASATDSERFENLRMELWWALRQWIKREADLPEHDKMLEDLVAPKYKYTSRGRLQLESKDAIKSRIGRSPDFADALILSRYACYTSRKGLTLVHADDNDRNIF